MDKAEYQLKLAELTNCVEAQDYERAMFVADQIDWRRVKSLRTLNMVADVYEVNHSYEKCREILNLALSRSTVGKNILYRLTEMNLYVGDVDEAISCYRKYEQMAGSDNARYILQYKIEKARRAPLEKQISILEEYRSHEFTERWAYELATLYDKGGDGAHCVEVCDDLILWFSEGRYVVKALELKQKYQPLLPSQQQLFETLQGRYQKEDQRRAEQKKAHKELMLEEENTATVSEAQDVLRRMDQAGASAVKNANADEVRSSRRLDERVDRMQLNSKEFLGKTVDLSAQLQSSIAAVFPEAEEEKSADMEIQFTDSSAEKEAADFAAAMEAADKAREAAAQQEAAEQPAEEEVPEASAPVAEEAQANDDAAADQVQTAEETGQAADEMNLESLFAETAGSFSRQIAEGGFEQKDEVREPAVVPAVAESLEKGVTRDVSDEAMQAAEEYAIKAEIENTEEALATMAKEAVEEKQAEKEAKAEEPVEEISVVKTAEETAPQEDAEAEPVETEAVEMAPAATEAAEEIAETAAEIAVEAAVAEEEPAADAETTVETAATEETPELPDDFPTDEALMAALDEVMKASEEKKEPAAEEVRKPVYNEELEIPDPEPEPGEQNTHTIDLSQIRLNNTMPIDHVMRNETPEERRIRILNHSRPTRMSDEQRKIYTYFARVPGMDQQILQAITNVYLHAGEKTSANGNIAVMGASGTGKTRLTHGLIINMCKDFGMEAAKVARVEGYEMNQKDPAEIAARMSGGFLVIENAGEMNDDVIENLSKAMEFRTDCMIVILEDEKSSMRAMMKKHPEFAARFGDIISIPVFTNDELVTFARTYADENGCTMDDMGILALYTKIGDNQSEDEPVTIGRVKKMMDSAIDHAKRGVRHSRKRGKKNTQKITLQEKDFESE